MLWVIFRREVLEELSLWMVIDKSNREKVVLTIDAPEITQSEGPLECRDTYRSPEVNDLKSAVQQLGYFIGREVSVNASNCTISCLISVNVQNRLRPECTRISVQSFRTMESYSWFQVSIGAEGGSVKVLAHPL